MNEKTVDTIVDTIADVINYFITSNKTQREQLNTVTEQLREMNNNLQDTNDNLLWIVSFIRNGGLK